MTEAQATQIIELLGIIEHELHWIVNGAYFGAVLIGGGVILYFWYSILSKAFSLR